MRLHQWMLDKAIAEVDYRYNDGEIDETERAAQIDKLRESFESAVETQAEEILAEGGTVTAQFAAWMERHFAAVTDPHSGMEAGTVGVLNAVDEIVEGNTWPDAVGSPAIGGILAGVITLLNYDLGRLDAGTMDSWARDLAEQVGWDLDIEEIIWETKEEK